MDTANEPAADILLMADPRVAAVPVHDCGEELVDVRSCGTLSLSGFRADDLGDFAQVRAGVLDRLARAGQALPAGLRLLIVGGYRPSALQRSTSTNTWARCVPRTRWRTSSGCGWLRARYVSPPELAPHSAGAAVDLTLCTDDGRELDLGTRVNATPEESEGRCYTDPPGLDGRARHSRGVLAAALHSVGFVNYPTEWWHWSYGDRYWAIKTTAPAAIYGPCTR